ncbi:MAG: hypothetical protein ABIQ97_07460 [Lysobacteraceae bacterium]
MWWRKSQEVVSVGSNVCDRSIRHSIKCHNRENEMSNAMNFLEMLGSDAELRNAPLDVLAGAMQQAHIDAVLEAAIIGQNPTDIEAALGATRSVCCGLLPADDDEEVRAIATELSTAVAA